MGSRCVCLMSSHREKGGFSANTFLPLNLILFFLFFTLLKIKDNFFFSLSSKANQVLHHICLSEFKLCKYNADNEKKTIRNVDKIEKHNK